ncbi:chemotaxis protein CheB [Roseomonas xinghualingensis]|uniref:chemotaxis protein CheB n=1 Tax=Roseomonas xinghualingensis TaxID=2986475 RepID=UPI0021F1BE71|nr:chemotaxis protein CheB [Roseomonas sp. SXEYE001]MCV4206950.1 chemotaxis protein CheB [Roseomonas sp. SXEYE001]
MAQRNIIAIGGSLGSTAVLRRLLSDLPADLPAAVLITTHMPTNGTSYLSEVLSGSSALPVSQAVDGQPIQPGHIYVAPPDRHLLAIDGMLALGTGPRENMSRPAIDPLFRSVAFTYGPQAIGVILTGLLNDGASGLHAIKGRGGVSVVQHPLDAEAPDMPRAALETLDVDHVATADNLAGLLTSLVGTLAGPAAPPSADLELEVAIAAGQWSGSDQMRQLATPSALTCPHCHGVLSEMKGSGPLRFRCQIGHAFTAEAVISAQEAGVTEAIRIAMRMMEERTELVARMAQEAREQGRTAVAELYEARSAEYSRYAATLRRAATLELRTARQTTPQQV